MNGTKGVEPNNRGVTDGSRFVYEDPEPVTPAPDNGAGNPVPASRPSPDAFMPRPTRPFPISSRDENPKRGNWWNKIEFIFACIAVCNAHSTFSVLPYLVYSNGGGIFLAVVCILSILLMFPYFMLEMALGQFSSSGFISVWNFAPLFKGLGLVATLYLVLHNALSTVLSSFYLLYGFYTVSSETLPWVSCSNDWNTVHCYDGSSAMTSPGVVQQNVSLQNQGFSYQSGFYVDAQISPANEFASYLVINEQNDLTNIGGLKPNLVFGLLSTWGLVLFLTCLGAKLTGKVALVLLPITIILTFALLIRGATLDGAYEGLRFYFFVDKRHVGSLEFWRNAMGCVVSIGFLGAGIFSSLASYNKFHNNFCLDAFLVVLAVIVINIVRVLTVATLVGGHSRVANLDVGSIAGAGVEFLIVNMPQVLSTLPTATAWSCVYFATLFITTISSSVFVVQSLLTTFLDVFHLPHSWIFLLPTSGIICVLSFLISLPMVTESGYAVVGAIDAHLIVWATPFVAILLPLAAIWVYGTIPKWDILRLPQEMQIMVNFFPKLLQVIFLPFWAVIIPLVMVLYFCHSFIVSIRYLDQVSHPYWMGYIMLAIGIVPLFLIPIIVGIYQLVKQRRSYTYLTNLFWKAVRSSPEWGPAVEVHRQQAGYSNTDTNPHLLNCDIHYNPTTTSPTIYVPPPQGAVVYTHPPSHSPPPPAYNGYSELRSASPDSTKNISPAPSSVGSPGLPSTYPTPLAGSQVPPASPATVSATDTMGSNRVYPSPQLDYTTGAETDLGLSEQEDLPFINTSSHETTL
ncbi:sodium-dependent proline transporter-like [Asterias amurensis]|uniref:sodium-dependent proline transporter-like n=1 Tax=Asterias amurensis TaxID=7602 RepID=UPI003AB66E9A